MKRIFFLLLAVNLLFAGEYVTVNIQGQLGNQLFQTAMAIAYARDHGLEARFPSLKSAINAELNLRYVLHRLDTRDFPEGIVFDPFFEPDYYFFYQLPDFMGKNISFNGYFPHVDYFARHSDTIMELFSPTQEIVDRIRAKYGPLLERPNVAIHIRTFFPDSIDPNNGIGRTNWDYFVNAIECFPEDMNFIVFSDFPEWVKQHFPKIRKNLHFIQGNEHYIDFYFISLCDHQVLGPKSTFSWWGAWLNKNPEKIVIRPDDNWLPDEAYPASWQKIKVY